MHNVSEDDDSVTEPLGRCSVMYYGVGHMLNDITASCWFTYLLLFLTDIGLSPRDAATVMLSGQIADGFATIAAGELIDRFGRFKLWHGAGSVLVAVSFSSVFGGCIPCKVMGTSSPALQTLGYSIFPAIFNVGWAATQVSHMSMLNCITLNSTSRVVLASCRNAFTMVANLGLYAVAFVVFGVTVARTHADIENQDAALSVSFYSAPKSQEVRSMSTFMYIISIFIGIANALMMVTGVTCRLVGVILEESTPEELQKQVTVESSVLEVLLEITKYCDLYLMERVLDDETENRVLSSLEEAGVFTSGGLVKEKVLFCSTDNGPTSFVRQLEPDWHIDTSSDIIFQLSRFIKYQLHISPTRSERASSNVFSSPSLEQFFRCV